MSHDHATKRSFPTLREAQIAAFRTRSLREEPGSGPQGYKCPLCPGYHVGHLPPAVEQGLASAGEWYRLGAGRAVTSATGEIIRATGLSPVWSRVGEAWRVAVDLPAGEVASKPSADPGLAAESLFRRLRRRGVRLGEWSAVGGERSDSQKGSSVLGERGDNPSPDLGGAA